MQTPRLGWGGFAPPDPTPPIRVPASSLKTQKNGVENSKTWIQGPGPLSEARSHREDSRGARIFENRRVLTPFRMESVNHVHSLKVALAKTRSRRTGNSPTTFKEWRVLFCVICVYRAYFFSSRATNKNKYFPGAAILLQESDW